MDYREKMVDRQVGRNADLFAASIAGIASKEERYPFIRILVGIIEQAHKEWNQAPNKDRQIANLVFRMSKGTINVEEVSEVVRLRDQERGFAPIPEPEKSADDEAKEKDQSKEGAQDEAKESAQASEATEPESKGEGAAEPAASEAKSDTLAASESDASEPEPEPAPATASEPATAPAASADKDASSGEAAAGGPRTLFDDKS